MQMENSIPIFGNGNASGKFHSRLSGRELEAGIPGNSRDREFPLMVGRKRIKSFKETLKDERAGRDARQRMMILAQSVLLPLLCMSLLLPLLSMSSQYANLPLNSINPSSTSCAVDSLLEKVRKCHVHGSCLGQFAILI